MCIHEDTMVYFFYKMCIHEDTMVYFFYKMCIHEDTMVYFFIRCVFTKTLWYISFTRYYYVLEYQFSSHTGPQDPFISFISSSTRYLLRISKWLAVSCYMNNHTCTCAILHFLKCIRALKYASPYESIHFATPPPPHPTPPHPHPPR